MINWPISILESMEVTVILETVRAGPHVTPPIAPRKRCDPRTNGWVMAEGRYEAISEGCVYYPLVKSSLRLAASLRCYLKSVEGFEKESVAVLSYTKSQETQALLISDRNQSERLTENMHSKRQKENEEREK
jgi:hypothetical protein